MHEIWHVRRGKEEPLLVIQGLAQDAAEKIEMVLNELVDQGTVPGSFYMVAPQDNISEGMEWGTFPYMKTVFEFIGR